MAWGHHAVILLFHLPGHRSRCVCCKLQEVGAVLGCTCTTKYSVILSLTSATPHSAWAKHQRCTGKACRLHKGELAGRSRMGRGTPLQITPVLDDRAGAVYKWWDTAVKHGLGSCLQRALCYQYRQWRTAPAENKASYHLKFLAGSFICTVHAGFLCGFLFPSSILLPPGLTEFCMFSSAISLARLTGSKWFGSKWSSKEMKFRANVQLFDPEFFRSSDLLY